jgi:hypothetical protein
MMVLLPEGRAISNPDTIKMIKVLHNNLQGKTLYVVSVKLDDDSELLIKTCSDRDEAMELAHQCTDLVNADEGGDSDEGDDSDEDSDEESSSF